MGVLVLIPAVLISDSSGSTSAHLVTFICGGALFLCPVPLQGPTGEQHQQCAVLPPTAADASAPVSACRQRCCYIVRFTMYCKYQIPAMIILFSHSSWLNKDSDLFLNPFFFAVVQRLE